MELYIGKHIVTFKPVGTLIIGAYGRIDLAGPIKNVILVEKEWDKWHIVSNKNKKNYAALSKKLLEIAIEDVIDGTDNLENQ